MVSLAVSCQILIRTHSTSVLVLTSLKTRLAHTAWFPPPLWYYLPEYALIQNLHQFHEDQPELNYAVRAQTGVSPLQFSEFYSALCITTEQEKLSDIY